MKTIYNNDNYTLTKPKNCYDMNYHLYDKNERKEYLVDIDSVWISESEFENADEMIVEDGYVLDIEYYNPVNANILKMEYAWKVIDMQ